ncbi:MAG: GFA family protein [Parvibaculum sp.]|nr:GFA family protein [Parvibaculum sp.]
MTTKPKTLATPKTAKAKCLCGAVTLEIDVPARWAFHDHGKAARLTHGAAYATYVGSWRKRFRILKGEDDISQFENGKAGITRSFCGTCGTPLFYETARSPHMVNIPRALFESRTGREPRYHLRIGEQQDWAYTGAELKPLKGFPGVMFERPKKKKPKNPADFPDEF